MTSAYRLQVDIFIGAIFIFRDKILCFRAGFLQILSLPALVAFFGTNSGRPDLLLPQTEKVSLYLSIAWYTNIWLIPSVWSILINAFGSTPALCNAITAIRFFLSPHSINITKYFTIYWRGNKKIQWTINCITMRDAKFKSNILFIFNCNSQTTD